MYCIRAMPDCLVFERHCVLRACARAWAKTGNRIAARTAIIAMTTSNSIRVKPRTNLYIVCIPFLRIKSAFDTDRQKPCRSAADLKRILPENSKNREIGVANDRAFPGAVALAEADVPRNARSIYPFGD